MHKYISGAKNIRISFVSRGVQAAVLLALAGSALAQETTPADQQSVQSQAKFDVWEYRILGNSVLPRADIETLLYSNLGPAKTLDDVEVARAALEKAYRDRGYGTVFVDIPEQEVDEGIVRLQVTEGTIARVRVTGAKYFSNRAIRAAVPAAQPGAVPHLPTVQQQLTDLNAQTPDRSVVPVMKAGPRPGTVDLGLTVKDELPVHASVEMNNQFTSNTTELRAIAAISYDNLFDRLDSLAFQYQTSPEDMSEVSVFAGSYTTRLWDSQSKLAFFYIDSDSDIATVGDGGATISVLGKGQIFGTRYINPFHASAAATHVFIGSVEYKDFAESVLSEDLFRTPISYMNLSVGHTSAWRFEQQQVTLASSANFGFRGMSNNAEEFRDKRARGRPNYWMLRADTSYSRQLPWSLNFRVRGAGQYAIEPVISNEQFSIGGADGVRGYREAEQLGDIGFKTSAELGYAPIDMFAQRAQVGVFMFYDFGRMSRIDPLRNRDNVLIETPDQSFRSAGIGFDFNAFGFLSGALTWAYPLMSTPDADLDGTKEGDSRIHFSIRGSW
ncbi:ShlB/FhaC/HecB family hemolysin secretion/activation protein [Steroidobacter agaridevorans]|nr:ShlB/FhaC/HecB family hemolysin secretion/activation protein [Steroidobacter agaridevorans]